VERFFLNHTKAELYEGALKRKIMLYPVSDIKDLLESPQLKARGFWEEIEHSELGPGRKPVLYPGAFAKASETPWKNRRRAPLIGEHNQEIYEEVNLSKEDLVLLKQANTV
jgi:crotonobetainyl-CoA:carnitine CoA-transferase CaiB-like acyl-CoA transferase